MTQTHYTRQDGICTVLGIAVCVALLAVVADHLVSQAERGR